MKKITLLFALLITSVGFSQEIIEDFEGTPSIEGFEGLGSATIADDPETSGTNGKTLKLVTSTTGNAWQGANVGLASGTVLELTTDKTIKVDVYSTVAFGIMAKVSSGTGPAAANTQAHTGNGWETLTFTFTTGSDGTATANGEYSMLSFFPNRKSDDSGWGAPVIDVTIYIDNINGVKKTAAAGPTPPSSAPANPPARDAGDVISLFSDAYTQTAVTNFDAGWCGTGSIEEVDISGNKILLWKNNPCQGIEFTAIDASAFTHMHLDLYILEGTDLTSKVFNLKFVDTSDNEFLEVNFNATSPALEAGKWISIDVEVNLAAFDKLNQFGITSGNLNNLAWYDNLYFYKGATASVDNNKLLGFSMFPNPAKSQLQISAKETITKADVFNVLGRKVKSFTVNNTSTSLDISELSKGIYLIKYESAGRVGTAKFIKE